VLVSVVFPDPIYELEEGREERRRGGGPGEPTTATKYFLFKLETETRYAAKSLCLSSSPSHKNEMK
jgi:hypothetical protein